MEILIKDFGPDKFSLRLDEDGLEVISGCCQARLYWGRLETPYCSECNTIYRSPKFGPEDRQRSTTWTLMDEKSGPRRTRTWLAWWLELEESQVEVNIRW